MEKLLELAKKAADKAEVYSLEGSDVGVSFKNAELHEIESSMMSGVSLRIIKNGKLGFAYTRNLIDREALVQNAVDSLAGGVEAAYDLPLTKDLPSLDTHDPSIKDVTSTQMNDELEGICSTLKEKTDGEIMGSSGAYETRLRIINSEGTDLSRVGSTFVLYGGAIFPGSAIGVYRYKPEKNFRKMPAELVDEIADTFNAAMKVVEPRGGKMKVVFTRGSMITLVWRMLAGLSAKSVYEKVSPIADKVGEQIWSGKLTVYDDPLDDSIPGARAFDDEGVATSRRNLVENGVLKGFFTDLYYAKKLGIEPTGNGYRSAMWGGDPLSIKPSPGLSHLRIEPGDTSLADMIKSMERGLVVEGALGAHSGNIPNGDYSVGVSPALYVENGEIAGRVKDAMIAGNIYETLKNIAAVGDTAVPAAGGQLPPIMFDDVAVACR